MLYRTQTTRLIVGLLLALAFTCVPAQAGDVYHCYFGNTHSHTSFSDGAKSTPQEHFSQAKAAGFDFYAVTDHALKKYPQLHSSELRGNKAAG